MRIHKHSIPLVAEFVIAMPDGAEILCVQLQNNSPYIWARISTDNIVVDYNFYLYMTGQENNTDTGEYIGTFQLENGLVYHLFYRYMP